MKKKTIIITLIALLTLTIFAQIISPRVNAVDVKITSVTPTTHRGKVGETVHITGTINTTDGWYQILFNNTLVVNGTAFGNNVSASFTVPVLPSGNYTLTLLDKTANIADTSWFVIETAYILKVSKPEYPRQLQQNATVNISISITGGKANMVYSANITVKTPANEIYSRNIQLSNTTDTGIGNATIVYPFGNAHTNYTGTYTVSFNGTLASDTFFIGLTDLAEYHRNDMMKIWAVGYSSLDKVNITIKSEKGEKIDEFPWNVTDGVVDASWPVPIKMLIGNYSVTITPKVKVKAVNDTQTFAVPGFKTEIVPRNLADEPVPDVLVRIYDKWANETYNVTSNRSGVATKQLERGEYNATAYFKKVKVGQALTFSIENESLTLNFTCQLTSLNITVVSARGIKIPFVSIRLYYNFTTDLDGRKSANETVSFQTDITGTAKQHSFLLNASYKLNASRYGQIFYQTTFANLELCAWNNITIVCPERILNVTVTDWEGKPIENALVELQELMGGLRDTQYTDENGSATFNCVFGKYHLKVYSDKIILLNETTVELFNNRTVTIRCTLYNLPICVKVVDYFGQPISNANVTLERKGVKINSSITRADGVASFREIGGTMTIKVYLTNQNLPEATLTTYVNEKRDYSNPILIKLGKYVVLAGSLVDTAQFAMTLLIIATIVLIAIIEIVRRKRLKPSKVSG
ncbi:MAG: carboxypeptidase-like regulatory domain-containing protein [Candidatus Bathyarchaeia archaeon]